MWDIQEMYPSYFVCIQEIVVGIVVVIQYLFPGRCTRFSSKKKRSCCYVSKKSPTVGPTKKRTPKKPEYLMARSQLPERGPLVRSHSIFDGM